MNRRRTVLPLVVLLLGLILSPVIAAQPTVPPGNPPAATYDPFFDVVAPFGQIDVADIQGVASLWDTSGVYAAPYWNLSGNAATNPASNFVGTTDYTVLEFKVNNQRAWRMEPTASTPNLIGGYATNFATNGVVGATIAGGGGTGGNSNRVTDDYGTIGGGQVNVAGDLAGTTSDHNFATVAGGTFNVASGQRSAVGGGFANTASGESATVAGGNSNTASGVQATVAGGNSNNSAGLYATIGGGFDNTASGNWSTVPGGRLNEAVGDHSLAAGRKAKANHGGAFVWADGTDADFASTATNQFLVRAGGGVGLGTNQPGNQLHVVEAIDDTATPANHVAQIQNSSTGNSADVLALKIGYTDAPLISNNYITFFKGDDSSVGAIEGNGSGGVVLAGPGGLFAVWLPKADATEELTPGEIVGVIDGRISQRTTGAQQFLVIADGPIVAGNDPGAEQRSGAAPVALLGLAEVRVVGPVQVGDWIVPSGLADGSGRAVASERISAAEYGQAVGRAWEAASAAGVHTVQVAIGLPGSDPLLMQRLQQAESQASLLADLQARLAALEQAAGTTKP